MTVALRACACPYAPCTRAYTAYARPCGLAAGERGATRLAAPLRQIFNHITIKVPGTEAEPNGLAPPGPFAYSGHHSP